MIVRDFSRIWRRTEKRDIRDIRTRDSEPGKDKKISIQLAAHQLSSQLEVKHFSGKDIYFLREYPYISKISEINQKKHLKKKVADVYFICNFIKSENTAS